MTKDPIADMLTRIRNGLGRRKPSVDIPASKTCRGVLMVLKAEGFVAGFDEIQDNRQGVIRIQLKYGPDGETIMSHIRRESKPSRRVYKQVEEIQPILGGLGVSVLSTPQGIISDRQARQLNVGGELLCTIW
jgi:small subunit ribosomal protein S8